MNSEQKIAKVMDRIKKLMALSQSPNQNEAATAAAAAASLMSEYELEEADLRLETGEAAEAIEDVCFTLDGQRHANWKSYLHVGLTRAFHCHSWLHRSFQNGKRTQAFRVVGRRSNVQTINYLYLYLVQELTSMSERAWCEVPATQASLIHGKHWKNSFLTGAAGEIQKRLFAQVEQEKAQPATNALVLVRKDQEEVEAFFNSVKPKLVKVQNQTRINSDAYGQGQEAGRNINLGGGGKGLGAAPKQLGA